MPIFKEEAPDARESSRGSREVWQRRTGDYRSRHPDVSAFWTSAGTMVQRFNVAELAARGEDGIVPVYPPTDPSAPAIVDALARRYCPAGVSEETRATAIAFVDAVGTGDLAARPAAAAAILLASPEFLVH